MNQGKFNPIQAKRPEKIVVYTREEVRIATEEYLAKGYKIRRSEILVHAEDCVVSKLFQGFEDLIGL